MVKEAIKGEEEDSGSLKIGEMLTLAIATSIDALAVGVTFALLEVDVLTSCLCIGIITFMVCYVGVNIGSVIGEKFNKPAKIVGGFVLIALGIKILVEGLLR